MFDGDNRSGSRSTCTGYSGYGVLPGMVKSGCLFQRQTRERPLEGAVSQRPSPSSVDCRFVSSRSVVSACGCLWPLLVFAGSRPLLIAFLLGFPPPHRPPLDLPSTIERRPFAPRLRLRGVVSETMAEPGGEKSL